ncbi:hypothetical protein D1007_12643 [Hordeum vulgare]|nr:hypothetical protein D1007_12643 [Hordeum vulgare]
MDSPSDANSDTSDGASAAANPVLEDFFDQLDLNSEEFNDVEIDEEDPCIKESVRWLALARVHTDKTFSPAAFYQDMRASWNLAQPVRFHPVGSNRFVVQASCLGDWERMMKQGPWLFRNMAVLMCSYDGFTKECGSGIHDQKKLKFGDWLHADGPNRMRSEQITTRTSEQRQPKGNPSAPLVPAGKEVDPEILDTFSSPVKHQGVSMEVDKDARKRLNMDAGDQILDTARNPKVILAITDGNYPGGGGEGFAV